MFQHDKTKNVLAVYVRTLTTHLGCTLNTGPTVPHADIWSRGNTHPVSPTSAVSLDLLKCTDIPCKSKHYSLLNTFRALGFLIFHDAVLIFEAKFLLCCHSASLSGIDKFKARH
jgi:hypothetical protein